MLHAWLSWKRSVQLCNEDHTPIIVFASSKFGALLLLEQAKLQSLNIGWSCCHSRFCQSRMWCTCPICWEMTPVLDICPVNRVMTSHWTTAARVLITTYLLHTLPVCVCSLWVAAAPPVSLFTHHRIVFPASSNAFSVFGENPGKIGWLHAQLAVSLSSRVDTTIVISYQRWQFSLRNHITSPASRCYLQVNAHSSRLAPRVASTQTAHCAVCEDKGSRVFPYRWTVIRFLTEKHCISVEVLSLRFMTQPLFLPFYWTYPPTYSAKGSSDCRTSEAIRSGSCPGHFPTHWRKCRWTCICCDLRFKVNSSSQNSPPVYGSLRASTPHER